MLHFSRIAVIHSNPSILYYGLIQIFSYPLYPQAAQSGILFVPTPRRFDSKTIYNFGSLQMYIDRGVPFIQQGAKWIPTSIYTMIDLVLKGS